MLLFTPDAGQAQQSASPTLQPIEPSSSSGLQQAARASPTSALQPAGQLMQVASGHSQASLVQPSGVIVDTIATLSTAQVAAPPLLAVGADDAPNLWRPIEATPPLEAPHRPAASHPQPQSRPSVQTDDLPAPAQPTHDAHTSAAPTAPPRPTPHSGRARPHRPPLGFTGQGARGRQSQSSGDSSTSGSAAAGTSGPTRAPPSSSASGNGRGSINGIRRPGLAVGQGTGAASAASAAPSGGGGANSDSPTATANAFQSRLNHASNRLRNRFKHRQPSPVQVAPSGGAPSNQQEQPSRDQSQAAAGQLETAASSSEPAGEQPLPAAAGPSQSSAVSETPLPVVGSDEVAQAATSRGGPSGEAQEEPRPVVADPEVAGEQQARHTQTQTQTQTQTEGPLTRRVGDQSSGSAGAAAAEEAPLQTGQLQQGSLSSGPLDLGAFFQAEPAGEQTPSSSSQRASFKAPSNADQQPEGATSGASKNDKLSAWLGQHHSKFVARPASNPASSHQSAQNNQLLSAQLGGGASTSSNSNSNSSSSSFPASFRAPLSEQLGAINAPANNQSAEEQPRMGQSPLEGLESQLNGSSTASEPVSPPLRTVSRTYSTVLHTSKTRLVPLQVSSSTAVFTITEDYVLTKLMTAYQTMPAGEFILPEPTSSSPFEVFATARVSGPDHAPEQTSGAGAAPAPALAQPQAQYSDAGQEQPISLDSSRSATDWLHDFTGDSGPNELLDSLKLGQQQQTNPTLANLLAAADQQQQQQQQNPLAGLVGVPGNGLTGGELDQLASSQLDPAQLLADGAIQIPDLNNPLVLAAAIQNPQLAAVILAAQQLQLKQRQQNKLRPAGSGNGNNNNGLQFQAQPVQLQPSYSTSLTTTTRQTTYTMRDTMYTTRLVSFRDGRTVRTRTVSEPGSVIEQTLTSLVTETLPVTLSIRPTATLAHLAPAATQMGQAASSHQATINNALFATQLAQILARRQQQLQTSFGAPALLQQQQQQAGPQQLLALQQMLNQQRPSRNNQAQQQQQQQQQQFQPNLQQLLQSMQQSQSNLTSGGHAHEEAVAGQRQTGGAKPAGQQSPGPQATPALPASVASRTVSPKGQAAVGTTPASTSGGNGGGNAGGPLTTTLTSLQVRTYTVHNAFKTIFRTITSTVLIPTVLSGPQQQLASMMAG